MLGMSRGDTIIEVLLAITVFSLVSIGSVSIMNQGTNASQRALEITHVRQEVDSQAEAIRAVQQAATSDPTGGNAWSTIADGTDTVPHYYDQAGHEFSCPDSANVLPNGSFVMDTRTASVVTGAWLGDISSSGAPPYAQVSYGATAQSYGLWIERDYTAANGNIPAIYSFTINACWYGAGLDHPLKIQSVVRLYDPAS
jgi:type II secretory pathway pseudopilin PulG